MVGIPEPANSLAPLDSIQILRAAAALAVLFAHLWPALAQFGDENVIPNFTFGAAGVDLFFVISGFIMVYTSERLFGHRNGPYRFLTRRLIRIVPMYWALTTIVLIGWYRFHLPSHATWTNVIGSYLFIPTLRPSGVMEPILGVGWTLNYEMFFYCLFAITVILPRRAAVVVLSALLFLFVNIPTALKLELPSAFGFWGSPIVYEFAFGMWIGLAFREGWRLHLFASIALGIGGLGLMIYAHVDTFAVISRTAGWGGGAALIIAAVALADVQRPIPFVFKPLIVIGDASYALYLFHSFVPIMLLVLHAPKLIDPAAHPFVYCVLIVSISLASAAVIQKIDGGFRTAILQRMKFAHGKPAALGSQAPAP